MRLDQGEAWDAGVTGRARHVTGKRKGYDVRAIVPEHIARASTPESLWAFRRYAQYQDISDVVWYLDARGRFRWVTGRRQQLEDRVVKASRRRERGLRGSMSSMAMRLGTSPRTLARVVEGLARRGLVLVTGGGRGRYSITKIVARSIRQPIGNKAAELKSSVRRWDCLSPDEQEGLRLDAYRWRVGLSLSLAAVGCSSEGEYLAMVGLT